MAEVVIAVPVPAPVPVVPAPVQEEGVDFFTQMKKYILVILLLTALLIANVNSVLAQNYSFQVEKLNCSLFVNSDGTATIEYSIDFIDNTGADPIDIVDIGLPNNTYQFQNITADINGNPITDITKSDYIEGGGPGIALGLGSQTIQPGQKGNVHVIIKSIRKILFPATEAEKEKYASIEFSPTWFGEQYVTGITDFTFTLYMPPGTQPQEPRYHLPSDWTGNSEPEASYDDQDRVYYRWHDTQSNAYSEFIYGASFPERLVPSSSIVKPPLINISTDDLLCWGAVIFFGGILVYSFYASVIAGPRRKLEYLPPKISIEGHGIKRGLTAVEAAILMEQPIDKILSMILFSSIKKGAVVVTHRDPLKLTISNPLPTNLQQYEVNFLEAFHEEDPDKQKSALQDVFIKLVRSISKKMEGFSLKETVAYYKDVLRLAWEQVESAGTPEIKMQKFDEVMDWTLLDHKFDEHTRNVFQATPTLVPNWWWRYDPSYNPPGVVSSSVTPISSTSAVLPKASLPHIAGSDFAASMVNGIQSFSGNVIGNLSSFTSKIVEKTNPIPVTTGSSSGSSSHSGGGHSCACACACAGCACACAGGGR